jgi:probable O-glycosylation ligase (exosortase A-associated)
MVNGPPGSYLEGNNALGLAAVMLVPLLRYLHLETAGVWVRRGLLAAMVLTVLSAVASYSRGALLAAFAMGLFLWSKSPRKLPLALGTAVVAAFLLQFMPEEWFDRMGTIQTYEEDRSAMGRVNAWWFAWNYALAHPIAGGGFDVVQPSVFVHYAPDPAHFADTHSIYFSVLAHHGFVGLFLFLLVLFLTWRSGSRIIRAARGRDELRWAHHLASMIQVSLVGYLVGGAFLNLAYWDLPYSLLAILVLTEYLVSQQGAELARVPADAGPPQAGPPGGEVPVAVGPAVSVPPPGHASKHGPGQGEGLAGGRHSLRGGTPAGPWL